MKAKGYRLFAVTLVLLFVLNLLPIHAMAADETVHSGTTTAEAEPTVSPSMEVTEPTEPEPTEEAAEPEPSEESGETVDPTEEPSEEPSESVNPTEEPSEEPSESADPTKPTEPVDTDADAVKPPEDQPKPEEPKPQPEAELNDAYVGQNVTVYEWFDANLRLDDGTHNTPFPYITTYGFNMNPSETEFTSSSKYGQLFYCIDFYAHAGTAGKTTTSKGTSLTDTPYWTNLGWPQRSGIAFALLYGSPNCSSYYDNIYGYAATQLIIWEYQLKKRITAADTVTFFNATLNQSDRLKEAYNSILSSIRKHEKDPSFAGQEVVLKGYGKANGVTLTDSNGLFANDAWKISGTTGFAVTQSGNSLTIYAPEGSSAPVGQTTTVRLTRNIKTSTGAALCAKTGSQDCITGSPPDPLDVMIRVRLEAAQLDIIKLTPDGKNVAGVEFEVYRGYDAVESGTPMYVGKTVAGTYQGKPCGRIQVGNLTPGNYYVHEIIPAGYTERPITSSQNVTEGSGSGAGWYYLKVSASNTKDNPAIVIFENQPLPGTATLKKTSPSGNVEGVCFKLYRWRDESSGQATWYGRSDAAGSVYVTDAGYQQSGAKRYTFEGLMDGAYDFREVLSQTQEVTFPSRWTVKVTDRTGKVTYDKTFTGDQILRDEATGDARLTRDVMGSLTGLTGGGRLEMEIVNVPIPGTARLQKTSSTGDVEGFCFKLYRHGSKETWYGRSGENGGIYLTDSSYEAGEQVYEFAGLTDGTYTVLEALSQSDQHLKTTGWTLTVYNKDGVMTSKQTFGEGEFTFDANGDARLAQVEITGLNGGGRLEISINNEPILGAITIDKADEAGRPLKGATFRLEYFDGDEWIPVRPGRSAGIGLCSSAGLTAGGELTTGESGTVTFEGLMLYDYDEAIVYRVTETQAPPNYQLLAEPVFEDVIQPDTNGVYHAYVNVINTPVFLLPPAGEGGFQLIPIGIIGVGICVAAVVLLKKKQCN